MRVQLDRAERAWFDAYADDDQEAMACILASGFTITFPDGFVQTRDAVIASLSPNEPPDNGPAYE